MEVASTNVSTPLGAMCASAEMASYCMKMAMTVKKVKSPFLPLGKPRYFRHWFRALPALCWKELCTAYQARALKKPQLAEKLARNRTIPQCCSLYATGDGQGGDEKLDLQKEQLWDIIIRLVTAASFNYCVRVRRERMGWSNHFLVPKLLFFLHSYPCCVLPWLSCIWSLVLVWHLHELIQLSKLAKQCKAEIAPESTLWRARHQGPRNRGRRNRLGYEDMG